MNRLRRTTSLNSFEIFPGHTTALVRYSNNSTPYRTPEAIAKLCQMPSGASSASGLAAYSYTSARPVEAMGAVKWPRSQWRMRLKSSRF